jgi:hypothetical protein
MAWRSFNERDATAPARARAWTRRAGVLLGLTCVFLAPMATLAIACTASGPTSAIPETALDRMLTGRVSDSGSRP